MSDTTHTSEKHDAEGQKSGPPPSVPYNATHTPPAIPKEPVEEPFDDTDSLYRMPTPPPKNARRNAVVSGMGDGSSSVYSEHAAPEPAVGISETGKMRGMGYADTCVDSERNSAASLVSDYGPVTYRY